jgi:hypothetical protein
MDSDIDGDDQAIIAPPAKRRRACNPIVAQGALTVFLIFGVTGGLYQKAFKKRVNDCLEDGLERIISVGLGRWEFMSCDELQTFHHPGFSSLRQFVVRGKEGTMIGAIVYKLFDVLESNDFDEVLGCSKRLPFELFKELESSVFCQLSQGTYYGHIKLIDLIARWQSLYNSGDPFQFASFLVCNDLALQLPEGWPGFHIIPLLPRAMVWKLLICNQPTRTQLARLMAQHAGANMAVAQQLASPRCFPGSFAAPFALIRDWLDATRYLKNIQKVTPARKAWDKLLSRIRKVDYQALPNSCDINYSTLRRARVRFDAVCMLLFGIWFANHFPSDAEIFIYTDGSPQWRGVELFATSFDIVTYYPGWSCVRRLFPVIQIGHGLLSVLGKAFAVLWQIMLLVGPNYRLLRRFCSRVRSLTTDFGVERMVSNGPDILPAFCFAFGIKLPLGYVTGRFLFPNASCAPGWRHLADNLMKRGLNSLDFWPLFQEVLKAITKLLRDYASDISGDLKRSGHHAASALISSVSMPHFATWRWHTADAVCTALASLFDTLCLSWEHFTFLSRLRDLTLVQRATQAVRDKAWRLQFKFVRWYLRWLTRLQRFVGTCTCHPTGKEAGADSCNRKGRILSVAHDVVTQFFKEGLGEANAWTSAFFDGDASLLAKAQGTVRMVVGIGKLKFDFLLKVPYLFARLGRAGVKEEILKQWGSAPSTAHCQLTCNIMMEGGDEWGMYFEFVVFSFARAHVTTCMLTLTTYQTHAHTHTNTHTNAINTLLAT